MNRKIFIVEDDDAICDNLKELLEGEHYQVDIAREGFEALQKLRTSPSLPAFIILDLKMPGMDGFQFRAHQEQDQRLGSVPIVLMTADGQIEEKRLRVGAKAFLRKPVDIDAVLQTAKRYCG